MRNVRPVSSNYPNTSFRNAQVALGTYQDPYNKPEHEHTLKGRELYLFVIFYTVCVVLIVLMFEMCMPVLFNPNYPYPPDESPPK